MMNKITLSRKRSLHSSVLFGLIAVIMLFLSCEEERSGTTFINGKIVNPKEKYVVISDFDQLRDTLLLNEDGIFNITYDNIKTGLYSISYPGEYQSFYLNQGDSLSLRANTEAFDETLAFTGSHARENNYLITLFSDIEKTNMRLLSDKNKTPANFLQLVNSIKRSRLKKLKQAAQHYNFDDRFFDFAEFIIKLNSYYELERYPVVYDGNPYTDPGVTFPEEFFSHRNRLNINKTKLLNNYAYRPFVNALVSNLAYKKASYDNNIEIDLNSYEYNKQRLIIIDSIFENQQLKNYFATSEIRNYIRGRKNAKDINKLVDDYLDLSTDERVNEEIAQMAATYISLEPGNELPNFKLRDVENEMIDLNKKVKTLSVLYYWSISNKNYAIGIHDQVKDLQIKYPEIEFIGINIDNLDYDQWQDVIAENDFRNSREFQVYDNSAINRQLALRNSNRSMVIDADLTIIDPNINLFYYNIETTLLGYLNR